MWHALLNKLLPPNVFFIQVKIDEQLYFAKYAVVSKDDLLKKTSKRAFHPYFWARFVQPLALIYVRNEEVTQWINKIQMQAILTLMHKANCMLPLHYSSQEMWCEIFRLTYATELRAESKNRPELIYASNTTYYDDIAMALRPRANREKSQKITTFFAK